MSQPARIHVQSVGVIGLALVLCAPARIAQAQCETNELQTLTASETLPLGNFGRSISISGDTAFIGGGLCRSCRHIPLPRSSVPGYFDGNSPKCKPGSQPPSTRLARS